jgi:hypothetical protein
MNIDLNNYVYRHLTKNEHPYLRHHLSVATGAAGRHHLRLVACEGQCAWMGRSKTWLRLTCHAIVSSNSSASATSLIAAYGQLLDVANDVLSISLAISIRCSVVSRLFRGQNRDRCLERGVGGVTKTATPKGPRWSRLKLHQNRWRVVDGEFMVWRDISHHATKVEAEAAKAMYEWRDAEEAN